ncbi:MAG: hypothetical protein JW941_13585 [Candidatus Coatesbacteria bacterium]|nr:hypothetical protein [Candidatus Coatesbacteria bacterium]
MPRGAVYCALCISFLISSIGVDALSGELRYQLAAPVLSGRLLPDGIEVELTWDGISGAYEYYIERDYTKDFLTPVGVIHRVPSTSRYLYRDDSPKAEMQTLYYRVRAVPSASDLTHEASEPSNVVELVPVDPTPDAEVAIQVNPSSLDFQTFIFYKQITVKNVSGKALKMSIWPSDPVLSLSTPGFWLDPWQTRVVEVRLNRASLEPGLHSGLAISFLSNAGTISPAASQDGVIDVEAEVAGPVEVAPLGTYFLLDDTPNGDGLIGSGETVNCQFKLVNTDTEVEALDLTVRIFPQKYVSSIVSGAITNVNNLPPMNSAYVPFSFRAAPIYFDCDMPDGPVIDAEFLVVIYDTFGYSWEQVVKAGVCTPLAVEMVNFEIDDDNQGVSATVPHTHNKMIECGEIIEGRVTFLSNYDLYDATLTLSDNKDFEYLPSGDSYSYTDVDDLEFIPMCGEVTPDRDFEFRALEYDASEITFTLSVEANIMPDLEYASDASYPVAYREEFTVNGPYGPDVTTTTTNPGPRMRTNDPFSIYTNVRNLGTRDMMVDLYVGAMLNGKIFFLCEGGLASDQAMLYCPNLYLTRRTTGPKRMLTYSCPGVGGWTEINEILFMSVLQEPGVSPFEWEKWYSSDWVVVNVNY